MGFSVDDIRKVKTRDLLGGRHMVDAESALRADPMALVD